MSDPFANDPGDSTPPQSPGECPFGPRSPFAEHYRPPRLGIIHLLAWTAATAVLLKFSLAMEMIRDARIGPTPQARHVFVEALGLIGTVGSAAALVGAGILLLAKIRRRGGRLQPGHWLLVIVAAVLLLSLLIWGLQTLALLAELDGYYPSYPRWWVFARWSLPEILSAGMYFYAALASKDGRTWKSCFGVLAAVSFMWGLWYVGLGLSDRPWLWFNFPLGSMIVGLVLLVTVLVDLRHGPRRDWLHWLGVAVVATSVLIVLVSWLWWVLFAGLMS